MAQVTAWGTLEEREELRRLWIDEEWSAARLGREYGISKNTIIGRITRLGLNRFTKAETPQPTTRDVFPASPGNCRWPIGHPIEEGFHFCEAPVHATHPYCLSHCEIAYVAFDPAKRPGSVRTELLSALPATRTHDGKAPRPQSRDAPPR